MAADSSQSQVQEKDPFAGDTGISEEDRQEVLKSIEGIASENALALDEEIFVLKEAKSGVILPILINLLAVAVVAATIFFLSRAFQNDTIAVVERGLEFSSLEGQLLRELQAASQDQISAKEQEIRDFENRLGDLESQRQELSENLDSDVAFREAQYDQEVQDQLDSERARLESEGITAAEIDRLLAIQEVELRVFYTDLLTGYQEELLLEQEQLAETIVQLEGEYSSELDSLKTERDTLVEDLRIQEGELRAELEQQSQALAQVGAAEESLRSAQDTLAQLEEARQAAEGVEAQLIGLYTQLQTNLNRRDWESSLTSVEQIQGFLNEEDVVALSLGSLAGRRQTDLFVVATIGEYVQNIVQNEQNSRSVSGQLEILNRIRANNERASAAIANNNEELAADIYSETMSLMPELDLASTSLLANAQTQFNDQLVAELEARTEVIADLVEAAETAIENGNYALALNNFDSALRTLPEFNGGEAAFSNSLVSIGYTLADRVVQGANVQPFNAIFNRLQVDVETIRTAITNQIQDAVRQREGVLQGEIATTSTEFSVLQQQYEDQLNDLRNELSSSSEGQEDSASTIAGLNIEIASLNSEIVGLNSEITGLNSEVARLTTDVSGLTTDVSSLDSNLSSTSAELTLVQTNRDEFQQRASELQGEVDRLAIFERELNTLRSKYNDFQTNIGVIVAEGDADGFLSRQAIEDFLGSRELEFVLPDFRTEIRRNYSFAEGAGRQDGLNLARDVVVGFSSQATPAQQSLYLETEREFAVEDGNDVLAAFLNDLIRATE